MIKKAGTIYGLILGLISVFGVFIFEGGTVKALFLLAPIIIVFGGTFAATIIGFGFEKFKDIWKLIKIAYFPRQYDLEKLRDSFINMSVISRREGLLSLDKELKRMDYVFPKKLVGYAIDGSDAESIENFAWLELKAMKERHDSNIAVFTKMGGYAPTMGILGTVMALIITLANAGGEPNLLIRNISTAFIATMWGVFSANLLWFPIADRLKKCHLEEKNMMEISLEGVLAIQRGEIPSVVRARLNSILPQSSQKNVLLALG
ncbi:MAG: MotA/TolQ/ExbB proton channel family protein [Bacteroidetes bacterium]|nr:MotA/TolQ/ExbB proton channel family protein [Bacteroidota bacterium]